MTERGQASAVGGAPTSDPAPPRGWRRAGYLLTSFAMSLTGDQIMFIAMVWAAAQIGGPVAVLWVTVAESVPRAIAMIFGGAISDAIGPRLLLLRTTAARVVMLVAATGFALVTESVALLVVIALLEGALLGLGTPPYAAVMPQLVSQENLVRANSVRTMVSRLAPIVGSPAGAWLVAAGQLASALAVVCAGAVISLVCLVPATRGARPKAPTGHHGPPAIPLWRRCGGGFALLRSDRRLRLLFVSGLCLEFAFAWPMNPGLPLVVIERNWSVAVVGLLIACWAGGALATAGLGAVLGERLPVDLRLVGGAVVIALSLSAMILVPSVWQMAVLAALLGAGSGLNAPASVTLYQQAAPPDRLGVAMALLMLSSIGLAPIAYAVVGVLASLTTLTVAWSVSALIAFGGPVTALAALRATAIRY